MSDDHTSPEVDRDQGTRRIRALSRAMCVICIATAVLLPAGMLVYWLATPADALMAAAGAGRGATSLGVPMRVAGFAIAMIPLGVLVFGLHNAARCFVALAAGRVFSVDTIGRLRTFSLCVLISTLLKPLAGAALSVLLSSGAPAGSRVLAVSVGSDTLLAIIFAGLVTVISWVMLDAMAIVDEHAQFV